LANVPPLARLEADGGADVILVNPAHRQAGQIAQPETVMFSLAKALIPIYSNRLLGPADGTTGLTSPSQSRRLLK